MTLLRIWLMATAVGLGGVIVYEYAPLLIVIGVVALGLGVLTAAIVSVARRFAPPPPRD